MANKDNQSVCTQASVHAESDTATRASIEELVEVASTFVVDPRQQHNRGTAAGTVSHATADMNSLEPLSLWESHRGSSMPGGDQRRRHPLPKSPVWSVRSSDSDGADSVGSGGYDDEDDHQNVHAPMQVEELTRSQQAEQKVEDAHVNSEAKEGTETQSVKEHKSEWQRSSDEDWRQSKSSVEGTGSGKASGAATTTPISTPQQVNAANTSSLGAPHTHAQTQQRTHAAPAQGLTPATTGAGTGAAAKPTGGLQLSADLVASTRHGGRSTTPSTQPRQQLPIASRTQPRKRMLTAAEVRARDALANEKLQAATAVSKLKTRRSKDGGLAPGGKRPTREGLARRRVVDARIDHQGGAAFGVPGRHCFHTPSTTKATAAAKVAVNSAIELVDDGTGTMLVTSPWTVAPAQLGEYAIPANTYSPAATLIAVRQQVEYYFSDGNLAQDKWLVSQMDADGFVDLQLLATFNRVRALTTSMEELYHALSLSHHLELVIVSWSPPMAKVRRASASK
jgi:hypothetical protein